MTRHQIGEAVLTAGSMGLLVAAIIAIDSHAEKQVTALVEVSPFRTLDGGVSWLEKIGFDVFEVIRYQSLEHAPLTVFFVVAMVLLVFMIRT